MQTATKIAYKPLYVSHRTFETDHVTNLYVDGDYFATIHKIETAEKSYRNGVPVIVTRTKWTCGFITAKTRKELLAIILN